jgi:hypothetical protein
MNVTFLGAESDAILNETLMRVDGESHVGPDEVSGLIDLLNTRPGGPFLLDLIAHAGDGVLSFGKWKIAAQDPSWDRVATDAAGKIGGVRLLGCYTALTEAGQQAMYFVKAKLKVDVRGAFTVVSAGDFDKLGFQKFNLLREVGELHDPEEITEEMVASEFKRLPRLHTQMTLNALAGLLHEHPSPVELPDSAAPLRLEDLLASVVAPQIRTAPGLLAAPEGEILYRTASGIHRATLLLKGSLLRLYPRNYSTGVLLLRKR